MKFLSLRGPRAQWYELGTSKRRPISTTPSCSRRRLAPPAKMEAPKPANYLKWPKENLVKRIKELERAIEAQAIISHNGHIGDIGNNNPAKTTEIPPSSQGELEDPPAQGKKTKPKKTPSDYSTRFIALKLAYIGKNYNGFEYQSSGSLSTIEEELWRALVRARLIFPDPARPDEVSWNVCEFSKCGRTDRGVSAFGQVVALRVRSNKPLRKPATAANPAAAADGEDGEDGEDGGVSTGEGEREDVSVIEGGEAQSSLPTVEEGEADEGEPFPLEQELQYCRMLNRLLPRDIRVYAWCPDPGPDFSARFNCRERQYRYFFTQPAFSPMPNFLEDGNYYNGKVNNKPKNNNNKRPKDGWLNIDAMRQAAKLFEGLHDFRNFCKIDPSKQITNFMRRIFEADIVEVDGVDTRIPYLTKEGSQFGDPSIISADARYPKVYYFHVRGSAFLWHQIRCMVAILFLVGQGLEPPSIISTLLDAANNPRRPNYVLADDAPLVLWDCIFGKDNEQGAPDEMQWIYVGGAGADPKGETPMGLHGPGGLAENLWESWHSKKMDEILANQLVDWIAQKTDIHRVAPEEEVLAADSVAQLKKIRAGRSTRVYEGGNVARFSGVYVPVMKKDLMQSPEEQNEKYAQRYGFKSAQEMREGGMWRDAVRAAKKEKGKGKEEGAATGE